MCVGLSHSLLNQLYENQGETVLLSGTFPNVVHHFKTTSPTFTPTMVESPKHVSLRGEPLWRLGRKNHCGFLWLLYFISFGSLTLRKARCHVIGRTLTQLYGEAKNWELQPTATWGNQIGSGSSSPSQVFRWLWSQLRAYLQAYETP